MKVTVTDHQGVVSWAQECQTFHINDSGDLMLDGNRVGFLHTDYGGVFIGDYRNYSHFCGMLEVSG